MEKFNKLSWQETFQLFNTHTVLTKEKYEKNCLYYENAKKSNMNPVDLEKVFKRLCSSLYNLSLMEKIATMPSLYACFMESLDRRLYEESLINRIPLSYDINASVTDGRLTLLNLCPLTR